MLRRSPISRASASLLWCLTSRNLLLERVVAGAGFELLEQREIVEHGLAADLAQQVGQSRVGQHQPAAEGDAVGLVGDAAGIEMVEIVEHGLLHQVGMHRRDAVDAVRADEGQLSHPHPAAGPLVDQRHRGAEIDVAGAALVGQRQMRDVDAVDDFEMARQQPLEQFDRPGLQRLRQQRVVGVGQRRHRDLPRLVPAEIVQVDQDPHQLGDGEARMGVVELHRDLGGQAAQLPVGGEMPLDQILQRGRDEEIFLAQPQFAARRALVVRIEEFADRFRARFLGDGAEIVAGVEDVELERIGRARRPQPQRVDVLAAPADDRGVVGDGLHGFGRMPDGAVAAAVVDMLDAAAEMNVIDHLRPLEFPGVAEAEPFVGIFVLPALRNDLAEQAEIVADAVADGGDGQRRHALHEAGREPPEAAIAERRVRLAFAQVVEPDAEIAERCLEHRQQAHIVQRVGEQAADQEFEREIIDPLAAGVVALLFGRQPAVHDAVAQRQRRRLVPVALGRHAGVLADRQPQLGEDRALDLGQRQLVDRLAGQRVTPWEVVLATLQSLQLRLTQTIRALHDNRNRRGYCCALRWYVFMQGPGRFRRPRVLGFGARIGTGKPRDRGSLGRNRAMRLTIEIAAAALLVVLHQRHQRRLCRRQGRPQRRRLELLVQRPRQRLARRPLRLDQAAMRRKILRQLLRRQDAVGDVRAGRRRTLAQCIALRTPNTIVVPVEGRDAITM